MESCVILLEEYKTVRQESLDALNRHQTVVQYGLAATGVGSGLGLITAAENVTAGAVILMGLIPTLIVFGIVMIGLESERVATARRHLQELERRINEAAGHADDPLLFWEAKRARNPLPLVNAFPVALAVAVVTAVAIGPVIGGALLINDGLYLGFVVGTVLDAAVLLPVTLMAVRRYRALRGIAHSQRDAQGT